MTDAPALDGLEGLSRRLLTLMRRVGVVTPIICLSGERRRSVWVDVTMSGCSVRRDPCCTLTPSEGPFKKTRFFGLDRLRGGVGEALSVFIHYKITSVSSGKNQYSSYHEQ